MDFGSVNKLIAGPLGCGQCRLTDVEVAGSWAMQKAKSEAEKASVRNWLRSARYEVSQAKDLKLSTNQASKPAMKTNDGRPMISPLSGLSDGLCRFGNSIKFSETDKVDLKKETKHESTAA